MVDFRGGQKASGGLGFGDIVGQADLKEALLAVAANDELGGLLAAGEKGTAKSTTVRALADLLPPQTAVADCPYGCPPDERERQCRDCRERADPPVEERPVPLVTLPLGATRERVVGTLSVADALAGDYEFEPGLLARANRGILYVDEVNLLPDHLVDVLLDAAAGGVNRVERDGVSVAHPAEFALVGTMNPEEGDLRPQLRDRFALRVTVSGSDDVAERVAIIDRAIDGEAGGTGGEGEAADDARRRLLGARELLDDVTLSREHRERIATLCRDAGLDGHRGDVATARAARTLAALDGRRTVRDGDVRRAAELALPHRLGTRPFEDAPSAAEVVDEHLEARTDRSAADGSRGDEPADDEASEGYTGSAGEGRRSRTGAADADDARRSGGEEDDVADPGGTAPDGSARADGDGDDAAGDERARSSRSRRRDGSAGNAAPGRDGTSEDARGRVDAAGPAGDSAGAEADDREATPLVPGRRRAPTAEVGEATAPEVGSPALETGRTADGGGRARAEPGPDASGPRVRTEPAERPGAADAVASVRTAARRGRSVPASRDLSASVRAGRATALVVFVVDASASMRPAMAAAKGTVMALLEDAYTHRDEVAFVAFAGDDADVLLPPTDSVTLAARHLKDLPTGDRTPLPAGLATVADVLGRADPSAGLVVLVTDGKATGTDEPVAATRAAARRLAREEPGVLVVDAGDGDPAGLVDLVVAETGGRRVPLAALSADRVDDAVGDVRAD